MQNKKVVLAYSGGLDTSVCIPWLAERGYEVIAYMADVGQGIDTVAARRRAIGAGASKLMVDDLKKDFAEHYILPSLRANATYERDYLLATALSRPLIARRLVEVAKKERAECAAHGCTGKGNDQVRFEVTIRMLAPELKIIAPLREWDLTSREAEIEYAREHNIEIDVTSRSPYSIDMNLWGVSIECGVLEDPNVEPPRDAYQITTDPAASPDEPLYLSVYFEKGVPKKLNDSPMNPLDIIRELNKTGGAYGIGRADLIEDRLVGIKSREIYEAPAATILIAAHRALEALVLDRELLHFKEPLSQKYGYLIYTGLWETPLRRSLDRFFEETQRNVTGNVRMKLYKGTAVAVGRSSHFALYKKELATYTEEDAFDRNAAEGFIKIWSMPYGG
ncbi:MAG: argininosuccinate synthase [Candidatus Omnitrophica bacterium]|nr:argininosuccinate synthase [Candidatus Omnitrophota bacterium]